jgi:hypothetical protein
LINENTWSQTINISHQPSTPSPDPIPITVPVNVTLPAPAKAQEISIGRVLAIIAGVFFLVGAGFFLLTAIIE